MNDHKEIAAGLHLVSVPIGNARDITLRALDVLAYADVLAAEDTRALRRLMEIHGVALNGRKILAYHDHNGAAQRPKLLSLLEAGKSVAYASEAGTPLIADPGFVLGRAVRDAGLPVTAAPGVTAAMAALTISGLPSDRFYFVGFTSTKSGERQRLFKELCDVPATLLFYESPRRLPAFLADAAAVMGAERRAVICREITKKFEEAREGSLAELHAHYDEHPAKGEIVVLIDRAAPREVDDAAVDQALKTALQTMRTREAADYVADQLGLSRRVAYQRALALKS